MVKPGGPGERGNDTQLGLVKVILLVEDSEIYYSRLPLLYNNVLEQTKRIIDDVSTDELFKVLRPAWARPKILLATGYGGHGDCEEVPDSLLCLITDVKFEKNGVLDERRVQPGDPRPDAHQACPQSSSRPTSGIKAAGLRAQVHLHQQEQRHPPAGHPQFHHAPPGVREFRVRDSGGRRSPEAKSLKEFEKHITAIPSESLVYHRKRNNISLWLHDKGSQMPVITGWHCSNTVRSTRM
ncbi:MAG: hypothetical protein R2751_17830 [Bacteroidales bacterium]